jgi:hypothetical protein
MILDDDDDDNTRYRFSRGVDHVSLGHLMVELAFVSQVRVRTLDVIVVVSK